MIEKKFVVLIIFVVLMNIILPPSGAALAQSQMSGWVAEPAREWNRLFDRTSGWTGADGIYSIPLSGIDAPGSAADASTFFVFSDTFIGEVSRNGQRPA
ncbi:MAG: hypothetical protein HY801_14960, partial [Candidatus Lindowbacteria bacterium]|nr:hypothetical protein [Candidatus Lindowbacteria bacterium]